MIEINTKEADLTGWASPDDNTSRHVSISPRYLEGSRCVGFSPRVPELPSYQFLQSQLLQGMKDQNRNVVMITSARPGEGKTLTAINLSLMLAREFSQSVLLVDADLRKQMVHRHLGYDSDRGLLDHLVQGTPISELTVWTGIDKLSIISGGDGCPHDSSELLSSPSMLSLVQQLKGRYAERLVIFDLPAVLDGDDALAFAQLADSIVFVVEAHRTQLPEVISALNMLPEDKVAGLVLNKYH